MQASFYALSQTQLILIDDGSATPVPIAATSFYSLVRRAAVDLGVRVRLIQHDAPKGYLASVSAAARLACGTFLLLMNNDAVVMPGCLAALLATFNTHPTAGLVVPRFTNQVRFEEGARSSSRRRTKLYD